MNKELVPITTHSLIFRTIQFICFTFTIELLVYINKILYNFFFISLIYLDNLKLFKKQFLKRRKITKNKQPKKYDYKKI